MDFKLFFGGFAFLILAYLVYYLVKDEKFSSETEHVEGLSHSTYVELWFGVIMCIVCGLGFILRSLPA